MKAVKILLGIWIAMLALLGFVTAGKYVVKQIPTHLTPTPTPESERLTMFDIARNTLRSNPNYQCPSVSVITDWLGKLNQSISTPDVYNNNPLFYSCYLVYYDQYMAEAKVLDAQQRPVYIPQKPQLHSQSCSVIGNTVSCIGF